MQSFVVALIGLAAVAYAAWYWMPARWRRGLAARVAGRSEKLASTIAQAPGCSACESCGSCGTPGEASAREESAAWAPPKAVVKIARSDR